MARTIGRVVLRYRINKQKPTREEALELSRVVSAGRDAVYVAAIQLRV